MFVIGLVLGAATAVALVVPLFRRARSATDDSSNPPSPTGDVRCNDLPIGVMVFDETGRVLTSNDVVTNALGLGPEESIRHAEDLAEIGFIDFDGSPMPYAETAVARALQGMVGVDSVVGRELSDGSRRWALINTSAVVAADGGHRVIATLSDVTGRMERLTETLAEASQLRHQALYDGLTGLPNRTLLMDRLSKAGDRAARRKTTTALLVIDLNGFKAVNDSLGHAAGDEVLVQVAFRLRSALRNEDTAVRLGGDEFVVLCEDLRADSGCDAASLIAGRMRELLGKPYLTSAGQAAITASLGLSVAPPGTPVDLELLHSADESMLSDKRNSGLARGDSVESADPAATQALRPAGDCSRVFIVDDDAAMRLLASRIIEVDPHMTVVGDAGDGDIAIERILEIEPDIVLCDVMMPGTSGPDVVRAVRAENPSQLFAFWSATTVNHLQKHYQKLGVPYVEKDRIDELPTRLADVMAGLAVPADTEHLKPQPDWADTTTSTHPATLPRP